MRKPGGAWLREPLVHFIVLGLLLFVLDRALGSRSDATSSLARIELTEGDLRQLHVAWMAQWQRAPTPDEMRNLVASRVREEILYREALSLGLDKDDTIVRRRLAQKMEFLADDVSSLREPSRAELQAWYGKNGERFALPARISFHHLYFSVDRRGPRAADDAARSRTALAQTPANSAGARRLADAFMFQDAYLDRTPEQIAAVFGTRFAQAITQLKPGGWSEPLESGLGWHLVWIDSIATGRMPPLEDVEPAVKAGWADEQRAEARQRAIAAMAARYQVILPGAPATATKGSE
jgi:peptidyl-prolyl cis-trans isomerase C